MKTMNFEQMEKINGGWGCNIALGLIGAIYTTAASMPGTPLLGAVVGFGWSMFQARACG